MQAKLFIYLFSALLALALMGCGQSNSNAAESAEEKVAVEVKTVAPGELIQSLSYSGDIAAETEVKVFSKIPDRIEAFYVDDGDAVRKGAPIARIVSTTIVQAVRQAEAALAAARAQEANLQVEFERAGRLSRENAMSQQQYDAIATQFEAAKAQTEQAEALLKTAQSQLGDALVTAPISGIIGKRYCEAGDMTSPAQPLVSIVQMDRVKIRFEVTETDLGKLSAGQEALVQVKSYPEQPFRGGVSKISPVLDPLTRMAEVEVLIDNPGHRLKPGMFARVEVATGSLRNALIVPRYAVIENTTLETAGGKGEVVKNYYVFVVDSSRAQQRKLEVIYVNHENLAVSSGIREGEKLVTLGHNLLRDGSPVMVVKEE